MFIETQNNLSEKTKTLSFCLDKINRTLYTYPLKFPHITRQGKWLCTEDGHWTGGFWVGILWIVYQLTGIQYYHEQCLKLMNILENRKDNPDADFDLGFLYTLSFIKGYEITRDSSLKNIALEAADRLLTFYHNKARLIYTTYNFKTKEYGKEVGTAIIDIMMNLELLWWAWKETGDTKYFEVADAHTQSTLKFFIRHDSSTYHALDFDLESGRIIRKCTIHGVHDKSCWSRGQAWAIRGFFIAYHYSGKKIYQQTAIKLSNYYIDKIKGSNLPPWDFMADSASRYIVDSSAAAIAASAWLRFGNEKLESYGRMYLNKLFNNYLRPVNEDGILDKGCAYFKKGIGINESTIWGDYYLIEGLFHLLT